MEPPFCEDFLVVKAMSRILGNLLYVGGGMPANIDMNQFLGRSNSLVWLLESQQDTKLGHQGQGSVKERQCGWTWYFGHGHKACGVLCFTLMPKRDRESKQDREAHFVQMQQYLFRQRKCSDRIMIMGKSTSINIYLLPRSSQSHKKVACWLFLNFTVCTCDPMTGSVLNDIQLYFWYYKDKSFISCPSILILKIPRSINHFQRLL